MNNLQERLICGHLKLFFVILLKLISLKINMYQVSADWGSASSLVGKASSQVLISKERGATIRKITIWACLRRVTRLNMSSNKIVCEGVSWRGQEGWDMANVIWILTPSFKNPTNSTIYGWTKDVGNFFRTVCHLRYSPIFANKYLDNTELSLYKNWHCLLLQRNDNFCYLYNYYFCIE